MDLRYKHSFSLPGLVSQGLILFEEKVFIFLMQSMNVEFKLLFVY